MSEAEKVHPEPIEKNRRIRGSLRTNVTKLIKKIDEELASVNPNADSLQESFIILIEREQKLGNLDDIIIFQSPDAEIETEMEISLEYSEQIIKYKSRVNRYLSESVQVEPVRNSSDVSTLRKLYDEIIIQIRCLESLKVDINSYGNLLLPILYKCIPNDLVLRFNRQNSEGEVTVTSLLSCIKKEIEARGKDTSERSYICEAIAERAGLKTGERKRNKCLMLYESVFGWTLRGRDGEFNERTVGKESTGLFIRSSNESEENLSQVIRAFVGD
ncbi:uncharacterized protein CEXT_513241 [Caerostris extrusa]|uniref:Uncharacterized protein n=1 Tax=Caerostris extrusa TaxID=172846 RepID=A0AAV4VAY9_CAEEX|nr:uncharacterized protein CEXT_513241 [Caerostris extrusa]